MDFSNLPIVDSHCHFFAVGYVEHDLANTPTLSLLDVPKEDFRNTLTYRNMLRELRSFLKIKGSEIEILEERKRRMKENYGQYVAELLKDANIDTLVVDIGYVPAKVRPQKFEEIVPAKVVYVYRIETVVDEIWGKRLPFSRAEERFYEALDAACASPGTVALKQLIGYRTGLKVKEVKRSSLLKGSPSEKEFRDYFFLRAAEKSIEMGWPLQIHTGLGESNIDMSVNNPLLLKDFFEDPKYKGARIVLLHGSYPYSIEAGYLANVYPHVFLDLSAMNLFGPPYVFRQGIADIFNMCPLNKAMYGSDGELIPDTHWLAAKVAKRELASLFQTYLDDGLFDEDYALAAAKMILLDTAQNVYGLSV